MNVDLGKPQDLGNGLKGTHKKLPEGSTVIAPNLKKQSTIIDNKGNHLSSLDPNEKRVIKRNDDG